MFALPSLQFQFARVYHSRFAYVASILILTVQRSPVMLHLSKVKHMLRAPLVSFTRLAAPIATYLGGTHAVTGATGVVPAGGSLDPADATVGEQFTWAFRVTGETAHSYSVIGLPAGLVKSSQVLSGGVSSFGGVPEESGTFEIDIIGWRREGERGDQTPVYTMTLNIRGGEPPTILTQPIGGSFDVGNDVALTVGAEGGGLRYQWFKDGQEIPSTIRNLVDADSQRRVLVPQGPIDDTWRNAVDFDDSNWLSGVGGVGYERSSANTYDPFLNIDVEADTFQGNTSALIRIPFELTESEFKNANHLKLRVQYDDGYAAFLNGVAVSEANAPANLAWNSEATAEHSDALAVEFEDIDLAQHVSELRVGMNLLAIQVMNDSPTSSDLLCNVELLGGRDTNVPTLALGAITSEDAGDYRVEVSNGAGSIVSETVNIAVSGEVTGYEGWQLAHWAETLTVPESEPTADPDRDGKSNLEEYYLGTNPLEPDLGVGPRGSVEETDAGPVLTVRFPRQDTVGVLEVIEMSTEMSADAWQPLTDGVNGVAIQQTETESIVTLPISDAQGFIRQTIRLEGQ
ncbi:hypothetical protein OAG47_01420 [Verrucomicrobiales bacterium]|jgi:hypothetical protein|nr:hypothetical protein [Verrucomicrobiales bacterium]